MFKSILKAMICVVAVGILTSLQAESWSKFVLYMKDGKEIFTTLSEFQEWKDRYSIDENKFEFNEAEFFTQKDLVVGLYDPKGMLLKYALQMMGESQLALLTLLEFQQDYVLYKQQPGGYTLAPPPFDSGWKTNGFAIDLDGEKVKLIVRTRYQGGKRYGWVSAEVRVKSESGGIPKLKGFRKDLDLKILYGNFTLRINNIKLTPSGDELVWVRSSEGPYPNCYRISRKYFAEYEKNSNDPNSYDVTVRLKVNKFRRFYQQLLSIWGRGNRDFWKATSSLYFFAHRNLFEDLIVPNESVFLILDTSGSMGNPTETGETRLEVAKSLLYRIVKASEARRLRKEFALMVYNNCNVMIIQDFTMNPDAIREAVKPLQPVGWTPIAYSLERAAQYLSEYASANEARIVILTDGDETCGGDPVEVAKRIEDQLTFEEVAALPFPLVSKLYASPIQKKFLKFSIQVVGFAVESDAANSRLREIAKAGNGDFYNPKTVDRLIEDLFKAIDVPTPMASTPSVYVRYRYSKSSILIFIFGMGLFLVGFIGFIKYRKRYL